MHTVPTTKTKQPHPRKCFAHRPAAHAVHSFFFMHQPSVRLPRLVTYHLGTKAAKLSAHLPTIPTTVRCNICQQGVLTQQHTFERLSTGQGVPMGHPHSPLGTRRIPLLGAHSSTACNDGDRSLPDSNRMRESHSHACHSQATTNKHILCMSNHPLQLLRSNATAGIQCNCWYIGPNVTRVEHVHSLPHIDNKQPSRNND